MATAISKNRDLQELERTSSPIVRNELALRLSETRDPRVFETLIQLIGSEATQGNRGTLVHCLRYFDAKPAFFRLVKLVMQDNFEVAHEAFQLLESIDEVSGTDAASAKKDVKAAIKQPGESWRKELLRELAQMFH